MVSYRRNKITGGIYFFTVNSRDRQSELLIDHIDLLRKATNNVRKARYFQIDAVVILPDHLHTIWTLPPEVIDYSGRWRSIKATFTRALRKSGKQLNQNNKGEYDVWQRRYWEHTIRNSSDFQKHVDYIHYNPVKHGYVDHVSRWSYSSFHRCVKRGLLPGNWTSAPNPEEKGFGE